MPDNAGDQVPGTQAPDRKEGSLRHLDRIEHWLDQAFRLPGTNMRFGLDGLVGFIPGVGDAATAAISGYFMIEAWRRGARRRTIAQMAKNVGVDWIVGTIPIVGDLFDFAHKANTKNLKILRKELHRLQAEGEDRPIDGNSTLIGPQSS